MLETLLFAILLQSPSVGELERQGYAALRDGRIEEVRKIAKQIGEVHPQTVGSSMARGSLLLRAGEVKEALKSFDKAAELDPKVVPYLWQRGITQYYAGEYEAGRKQFVVHRTVNGNDVENAVWHFLCVARKDGFDAARKGYLPAPGDSRIPLQEVYDLFAGTASIKDVVAAMEDAGTTSAGFYGELYLGLYEEVSGNKAEARKWLEKCVARGQQHYMGDVARVHLQILKAGEAEKTAAE